jgi:hypothetical protein
VNIVNQKLGAEGNIAVDLVNGALNVTASENTPGVTVNITASLPLTYYIDAGAQKLNSPIVSAIATVLESVLKQVP